MSSRFLLEKDLNGNVTYGTTLSSQMFRVQLTPNTPISISVPLDCTSALFSYSNGANVWVDYGGPATLPSNVFSDTTSELSPIRKYGLIPGQNLSLISADDAYVHISFWL